MRIHLDVQPKSTVWRLNTSLLNDRQCETFIEKEMKDYMEFRSNLEVSSSVLWDAAKVMPRGKLIMWVSRKT